MPRRAARPRPLAGCGRSGGPRCWQPARGTDPRFDAFCDRLLARFAAKAAQEQLEPQARQLVGELALAVSAAILLQQDAQIGDLFCRSRLDGSAASGMTFGNLPAHPAIDRLIERALPDIG